MVLPAEGHDHIGCFSDQVKLTRALVQDLDEGVKGIKQLGKHGEKPVGRSWTWRPYANSVPKPPRN
jgi:hypothetical protein